MTGTSVYKPDKWLAGPGFAPGWVRAAGVLLMLLAVAAPAFAFTAEQADKGREVFRLQCARCHGPDGQGISNIYKGMTAPPLVGPAALPLDPRSYQKMRHFQFRTVRDVYEFASAVMPADQPASLSAEDYWNVIAYLLSANGVPVNGKLLTEDEAANLSLGPLQQRNNQADKGAEGMPPPAGNAPAIEGQGGGHQ
jgi:polar amino acid transport system substrate-binding protein